MNRRFAILLAVVSPLEMLAAQSPSSAPTLSPGAEVRVFFHPRFAGTLATGRLVDVSPTMIVLDKSGGRLDSLARSDVILVQVRGEGDRWTDLAPEQLLAAWQPPATPVDSQPAVTPGDRVRISGTGGRTEGRLLRRQGNTLVVVAADGAMRAVPIDPDTRIEVFAGRGGSAGTGFLVGLLIGAAAGAAGSVAACEGMAGSWGGSCDAAAAGVGGALIGGLAVGGLGALLGAAVRHDRWTVVSRR